MTASKRKTARDKLPNEPRRLGGEFAGVPLPFTMEDVQEIVKKHRKEQGLGERSGIPWR